MVGYSIVVVTWRSAATLAALVSSVNEHLDGRPELVVVDNDSGDDPERAARTYRGELRFVAMERNLGYGRACNEGVRRASGDTVVMLNPDTELVDSTLDGLADFAAARRALAGPRLLNPDGSVQPSASGSPVGAWPWIGAILPGAVQPRSIRRHTEPWRLERTVRVAWLTGACIAGPRAALLELGPFDPSIHLYAEDMDLGLRAARAGIPSYFCPDVCRIVHAGGGSTGLGKHGGALSHLGVANRRPVVARAFGARRERIGWLAQRLNLRLRATAKRALGADARAELEALAAARRAGSDRAQLRR